MPAEQRVVRRRRADGREKLYGAQRRIGWLFSILIALLVLLVLFVLWFSAAPVDGDSMAPALIDGEIVLCDRLAKYWKTPVRGDMIAFTTADGSFLKRIVGLPGETVEVVSGRVYIDSAPLDESAYADNFLGDAAPVTVPEGCVYVLGDNRRKMYDSRIESVGCIPYERIDGVLRFRVYPIARFTIFF